MPAEHPLPNELDPETGLHMTGKPQLIDLETYRLEVTGLVDNSLSLTYDELRCMPKVTSNPYLTCPGVFTDYASWTGVPIKDILELANVQAGATTLTLVSADGYTVKLPLETASAEKNFLAYEVDGKTLPVLHGFPLRAVFPSMWGSYWLKWLVEIRIS
jgi:DMSO/TMAO reductase YedYZ molybdopterin-dependent catalytic subunit